MTLIDKLPQLAQDKANHFIYGLLVFTVFCAMFGATVASCLVIVVAAAKEVYDFAHQANHTPDIWDFAATVAGGGLGLVNYLLGFPG